MATRKVEAIWIESRQRWQINVQNKGDRRTFTCSTPGKKGKIETEKKADKWLETMSAKDMRFDLLWKQYLDTIKITTGTSNYTKHESIGRLWLLPRVGRKRLSAITNADWQACVNDAYKKGLSKKTCSNIRGSITAVYSFSQTMRLSMDKPDQVTIPRNAPVLEKSILQPNDIRALFSDDCILHYGKRKPCFFIYAWRFIVMTGLRRGELAGLQKSDIQGNTLFVRRAINQHGEITRGKNDTARRFIVLTDRQKQILEAQAAMLKKHGILSKWLFPGEDGDATDPNAIYKAWVTYRKQHGISSSIHGMRHTMISIAMSFVPEQLLKRMVGHTQSMDTFGIYGHDVDGDMQRAASMLDHAYDRILGS